MENKSVSLIDKVKKIAKANYINEVHVTGLINSRVIGSYNKDTNRATSDYDYTVNIYHFVFPIRHIVESGFYDSILKRQKVEIWGKLKMEKDDMFIQAERVIFIKSDV